MSKLYRPWVVFAKTGDGPLSPPVVMGMYWDRISAEKKAKMLCPRSGCEDFWIEFRESESETRKEE